MRDNLTHLDQQFASMLMAEFPHQQQQSKLSGKIFADCTDGIFQIAPSATWKGASFALHYADKKTDTIPDGVAEIEYTDDSLIVCTDLNRIMKSSLSIAIFEKFLVRNFFWTLKKKAPQPKYREDKGAFLPITPSYFKVRLRHDRERNVRMKIILITTAAGNWGKNGIRRGRQR